MKVLELHSRIKKIMKIYLFTARITKIMIWGEILCQNHENHENLIIEC